MEIFILMAIKNMFRDIHKNKKIPASIFCRPDIYVFYEIRVRLSSSLKAVFMNLSWYCKLILCVGERVDMPKHNIHKNMSESNNIAKT